MNDELRITEDEGDVVDMYSMLQQNVSSISAEEKGIDGKLWYDKG